MNVLNDMIIHYRKLNGITQSELAEKLGISTAAVSKWEQGLSCPDISLLPELSDIFHISIDELFGRKVVKEPIYDLVDCLPWDDDRKIRLALFFGKKLMHQNEYEVTEGTGQIGFCFDFITTIKGICKYTNTKP